MMTTEEREKINSICIRIQTENDQKVFDRLIKELNDLLEIKQKRIDPRHYSSGLNAGSSNARSRLRSRQDLWPRLGQARRIRGYKGSSRGMVA